MDLILLIEHPMPDAAGIRAALRGTFTARATHRVPLSLTPPPTSWRADFAAIATEARLFTTDLMAGFEHLNLFWIEHSLGQAGPEP